MNPIGTLRQAFQNALLGPAHLRPQLIDMPLHAPQTQVTVWLHGMGEPRDVTTCHSMACSAPFALCIGLAQHEPPTHNERLTLQFREHSGDKKLLAEIRLKFFREIATDGPLLRLYHATGCTHYGYSRLRRWTRALHAARSHWKLRKTISVQVSTLDVRCNEIVFLCPRPIALVSIGSENSGNIFPMNLMGAVGGDHFVFALNSKKQAPAVAEFGQLALSAVPFDHAEEARQLGKNHHQHLIDWSRLPFSTRPSQAFGIPVPEFALGVRELKVESAHPLGSHTLFVARIVHEQAKAAGAAFYRIYGFARD